jgi:hypothetical protein
MTHQIRLMSQRGKNVRLARNRNVLLTDSKQDGRGQILNGSKRALFPLLSIHPTHRHFRSPWKMDRLGPVAIGLKNLSNGVELLSCPTTIRHHARDRQHRSHAVNRARSTKQRLGLSLPNLVLQPGSQKRSTSTVCAYKKTRRRAVDASGTCQSVPSRGLSIRCGRHRSVGTHYRLRRVISGTRSGAGA